MGATVDTGNSERGPLILIMGGRDHTVPEAITKSTMKQYRGSAPVTDLAEFPDGDTASPSTAAGVRWPTTACPGWPSRDCEDDAGSAEG